MLERIRKQGHTIRLYVRYVDDIFTIAHSDKDKEGVLRAEMEKELNSMDQEGDIVKVTAQSMVVPLTGDKGDKVAGRGSHEGIEYLDVLIKATYTERGALRLETGVYRRPAASDLYMLASSYHSWPVKAGMVKGEAIRYLIICSTEDRFKQAWNRYEQAMGNRGCSKRWLRGKRQVEWKDRDKYLNGYGAGKGDKRMGSVPLLIDRRPGTEMWWGSICSLLHGQQTARGIHGRSGRGHHHTEEDV